MRRIVQVAIATAVLAASLVLTWGPGVEGAPGIPVATVEAAAKLAMGYVEGRCSEVAVVGIDFAIGDVQYRLLIGANDRFVLIEAREPSEKSVIWFGSVGARGELKVTLAALLPDAVKKYPGPCDFLAPRSV